LIDKLADRRKIRVLLEVMRWRHIDLPVQFSYGFLSSIVKIDVRVLSIVALDIQRELIELVIREGKHIGLSNVAASTFNLSIDNIALLLIVALEEFSYSQGIVKFLIENYQEIFRLPFWLPSKPSLHEGQANVY
jgi:hypothetical protein